MPEIDEFLERLASSDAVPGGGSVAALEVAMGASLLAMVCGLTMGREKFQAVAGEIEEIHGQAVQIRDSAWKLVDADADAFSRVSEAMKLPRSSDEEKTCRRLAVQDALKGAVDPPLEAMRQAAAGIRLAQRLTPIGNPSAISDVGSAALSLQAGFHAARLNVDINLASIKDETYVGVVREGMPRIAETDATCREVMQVVEREIGAPA